MNKTPTSSESTGAGFLPDFCTGNALFTVLVIAELVAVLITLAAVDTGEVLWERLVLLSIYLLWIGLISAAMLCRLRHLRANLPVRAVGLLAWMLLMLVTTAIAELAWRVAEYQNLHLILAMTHAEFLARNLGVAAIVAALVLRYFWVRQQWLGQMLAVSNARYSALQSRIRPHFLFNTLNSIAELVRSRPDDAETAVEDLAALLRATLDEHDQPWPLQEELRLSRAYARIEGQRLGARLQLEWEVPETLHTALIPPLCLQPLIENAVRHGVEPLSEGGLVRVSARHLLHDSYELCVTNPNPGSDKPGMGEALENIRQRLRWLYGPEQSDLTISEKDGRFQVCLRLPLTPDAT